MPIYKSVDGLVKFKTIKWIKELGHWKFFKAVLSIDGTIIRSKWVKHEIVSYTCNKSETQKPKFLAENTVHSTAE